MRSSLGAVVCVACLAMGRITLAAAPQTYQVGAASVTMTPEVAPDAPPVWLAGYGVGRQAQKVHDDVYARALVLHDGKVGLAIVTCDLVGLFYDQVVQIRKEIDKLGLTPKIDYVLVSSTHTHAGPDTIGIWGPVGRTGLTPGFLAKVRSACVEAVREAHKTAKKATLRIAQTDANRPVKLIKDSREPQVIDSTITVIQALDGRKRPIVTFVNVPCHPEVLGSKNPELSSDFPSTMRKYIEQKFGGLAIFNTGTVGGLMTPKKPDVDPFTKKSLPKDEIKQMMAYGRIMGRTVERALAKTEPLTGPIAVKTKQVMLPVWNQVYVIAMRMGLFRRTVYDADGNAVEIPRNPDGLLAAKPVKVPEIKDPHLKSEVGLIQIGDLQIAAIPGEIYPELTLGKIQDPQEKNADYPGAPKEPPVFPLMTGKYKMLIGLANDEIGYILPRSQWDWYGPYCYGRKKRQYGEVNSLGPESGPRLMAVWARLVKGQER